MSIWNEAYIFQWLKYMSLAECNRGTTQKFQFSVNITIEPPKYNNYMRQYRHILRLKHTSLDGITVGHSC